MPISQELAEVYASAPYDLYYIETLQLSHPIFAAEPVPGSVFLTNQREPLIGKLEDGSDVEYEPAPFVTIPPNDEENSALQLQVAIDNSSRRLMDNLERLSEYPQEPVRVIYRVYLSNDINTVQNDPPLSLEITSVTASQTAVTFNAGQTNLRRQPFPFQLYTTELYPGLAR